MGIQMTCKSCGVSPCYLSCPTQDPYQGDTWAEHCDHEAGAAFDDHNERYAEERRDLDIEEAMYDEHEDAPYMVAASTEPVTPFVGSDDDIPF
jgi:hypothetical protein